jgi:hypothetical protein
MLGCGCQAPVPARREFTSRRAWGGAVLLTLLLGACDSSPVDSPADSINQLLQGRWLREYKQDDARVQRVLTLQPGGGFVEAATVFHADGTVTEHAHAGQWRYDGMNLKRKYSSFDGEKPSAPTLPYITHQIRFESRHEFVGTDNVRQREVRYHRLREGVAPLLR